MVKNPPANAGDTRDGDLILGSTGSSVLAWKIPWIEEGAWQLHSMCLQSDTTD